MAKEPIEFDMTIEAGDIAAWALQLTKGKSYVARQAAIWLPIFLVFFAILLFAGWVGISDQISLTDFIGRLPAAISTGLGWPELALAAAAILYFFVRPAIYKRSVKDMAHGQPEALGSQIWHVRISEDGMLFQAPEIESRVGWLGMRRYEESEKHFFLIVGPLQCMVIPKRDRSQDEITRISTFLSQKVAQNVKQSPI